MHTKKNATSLLGPVLLAAFAVLPTGCGSEGIMPAASDPMLSSERPALAPASVSALATGETSTVVGCTCFVLAHDFATTRCVSSLSSSGNETVSCLGTVSPAPAKTEVVFGQSCLLPQTGEYSTISQLVIASNGSASLRCQSK